MFTPGSVSLLREVYNWTLTDMDVNDIDDQKYMLCKRLSEVRLQLLFLFVMLANDGSWQIVLDSSSNKNPSRYPMAAT
jgi:hypothetical protein